MRLGQPARDGTAAFRRRGRQSYLRASANICAAILICTGGFCRRRGSITESCAEVEGPLIEIALDATGGNQAKCADLLGINRNTLRKKITELDIRVTRRRKLM